MRTHQVRQGAAFDCIVIIIVQGQSLQLLEALQALQEGNLAQGVCWLGASWEPAKILRSLPATMIHGPMARKCGHFHPKKNEKDSEWSQLHLHSITTNYPDIPRPSTAPRASEFQLKLKHNKAPPSSPTACHGRHDGPSGAMAQQGDCLQVIANDCTLW